MVVRTIKESEAKATDLEKLSRRGTLSWVLCKALLEEVVEIRRPRRRVFQSGRVVSCNQKHNLVWV